VAIGHPYDETIEAIARWLPQARARGIEPVPIDFAAKPDKCGDRISITSAQRSKYISCPSITLDYSLRAAKSP
jgi:hypothetical protein